MPSFETLIGGYKIFKATVLKQKQDIIKHTIALGIKPTSLIIAPSSLPISPEVLTGSKPGEIFLLSNVGGIVPPYTSTGVHGAIAGLEFAVKELEVENIILLSHSNQNLASWLLESDIATLATESLRTWFNIVEPAKQAVLKQMEAFPKEQQQAALEKEILALSMNNLLSYPIISPLITSGKLRAYAWFFDILEGTLYNLNPKSGFFDPLEADTGQLL